MATNELPPMTPGGQWLQISAGRESHYIVGEAHIKRLLSEGWQLADDPRKPVEVLETEEDAEQQSSDESTKPVRKTRK